MTNEQTDFVCRVGYWLDRLESGALEPLEGGGCSFSTSAQLFVRLYEATTRNEEIEIARITAMMLLEIHLTAQANISHLAAKWCELFGSMFAAA